LPGLLHNGGHFHESGQAAAGRSPAAKNFTQGSRTRNRKKLSGNHKL
jgi:hypothetical protein